MLPSRPEQQEAQLAKIEETPTSLHVEIGMPRFNGSIAHFDAGTRTVELRVTNFFFKSKPVEIGFSDIAEIRLIKTKSAAYPLIILRSGKRYNMPSSGVGDARQALPRMQAFLAARAAS